MTQTSSPWDGITVGDATNAPYSASEWAHLWAQLNEAGSLFPNYGILPGSGNGTYAALQVIATGSANIDVKIGAALVNGRLYETDAVVPLVVGSNASGNPRIDTVILRADYTAQTIRPVIKQGTPAGSPARPSLTQNTTLWEMPLADIAVANGFSTINQSDITDRRRSVHHAASGWQPYAYMLDYAYGNNYSAGYVWPANQAIAFPFMLAGNMLVDRLAILGRGSSSPAIRWGVYRQSTNDANPTTEKLLYRIGGRNSTTTISVANNVRALASADTPFALSPGAYWLLVFVTGATLTMGYIQRTGGGTVSLEDNAHELLVNGSETALGQTEDMTVDWTTTAAEADDTFALRLEGRVFGASAAF